jgi:hypothetical protein
MIIQIAVYGKTVQMSSGAAIAPPAADPIVDKAIMRQTGLKLARGCLKEPPLANGG